MADLERETVHLVRLALEGKSGEVAALARKILRHVAQRRPELETVVKDTLEAVATSPARSIGHIPLPVDLDSRLELVRVEDIPQIMVEPVWPTSVAKELQAMLGEREREELLEDAGLAPTRSLLFVGPPGVGKTLAARWLAVRTGRPLLTLDLAAVMSSFLGRTGNNIRVVLDYARQTPSVLLLDEFDSIAKRRDDTSEVGELKRLVTVLLQAIDEWPSSGILIAATNHPELLDPAVWRRFDRVIEFPRPTLEEVSQVVTRLLDFSSSEEEYETKIWILAALLAGSSFSEITRVINSAKRLAVVRGVPAFEVLDEAIVDLSKNSKLSDKLRAASGLTKLGRTQRDISEITGLSRDTIRKHLGSPKAHNIRDVAHAGKGH